MDLKPHIEKFRRRFAELESLLSDARVFDNPQSAQELSREYARLKELVAAGAADGNSGNGGHRDSCLTQCAGFKPSAASLSPIQRRNEA